jgi:hypothetical protein
MPRLMRYYIFANEKHGTNQTKRYEKTIIDLDANQS